MKSEQDPIPEIGLIADEKPETPPAESDGIIQEDLVDDELIQLLTEDILDGSTPG